MKKWGQRWLVTLITAGLFGGAPVWSQQHAPGAPTTPSAMKPAMATMAKPAATAKINLNTADEAALTSLKGIGKTKAQAVIEYRQKNGPFKSVDDLKNVKGIGDKTLANLRDQLSVE